MGRTTKHAMFVMVAAMTAVLACVPPGRSVETPRDPEHAAPALIAALDLDAGAGEIARLEDGKKNATEAGASLRLEISALRDVPLVCRTTLLAARSADAAIETAPYTLRTLEIRLQL